MGRIAINTREVRSLGRMLEGTAKDMNRTTKRVRDRHQATQLNTARDPRVNNIAPGVNIVSTEVAKAAREHNRLGELAQRSARQFEAADAIGGTSRLLPGLGWTTGGGRGHPGAGLAGFPMGSGFPNGWNGLGRFQGGHNGAGTNWLDRSRGLFGSPVSWTPAGNLTATAGNGWGNIWDGDGGRIGEFARDYALGDFANFWDGARTPGQFISAAGKGTRIFGGKDPIFTTGIPGRIMAHGLRSSWVSRVPGANRLGHLLHPSTIPARNTNVVPAALSRFSSQAYNRLVPSAFTSRLSSAANRVIPSSYAAKFANRPVPSGTAVFLRRAGVVGGVYSTATGAYNVYQQGNPIDAFEREGAGYVADIAETAFSASTTAFLIAPNPVTGALALGTGVVWAGAEIVDNWDTISDGAGRAWDQLNEWDTAVDDWANDRVDDAADWASDRVDDVGDAAADFANDRLDDLGNAAEKLDPRSWF